MTKKNKEKKVSISWDPITAANVRKILYQEQLGHSYEYPSQRINIIRDAIRDIDAQLEIVVGEENQ